MANAFRETPELLAIDLFSRNLIAHETWDKVQLQLPPLEKANYLLMAMGSKIAAEESDKTLRKLCRIMSKHENLKKLSSHMLKSYDAVLSGDKELRSLSDSESSEDDSDQLCKDINEVDFCENIAWLIPYKWRVLGIALGIPSEKLDGIGQCVHGDQLLYFVDVFEAWRSNPTIVPFSWSGVVQALQRNFVGENALATKLIKIYSIQESFLRPSLLKDPPTLPDFLEHVATSIPSKYFRFGMVIGVNSAVLKGYQTSHNADPLRCFECIFNYWKNGQPGAKPFKWSSIVTALAQGIVGENALAWEIEHRIIVDGREDTSGGKEDVKAYEAALKEGKVSVKYGRVLLLGPARVGKTSLKRGLMNEPFRKDEQITQVAGVDTARPVTYGWAKSGETYWERVPKNEIEELGQLMAMVKPREELADIAESVSAAELFSLPDLHSVQKSETKQRDVTIQQSEPMQQSEPKEVKQKKEEWARLVHDMVEKARVIAKSITKPKVESDILLYLWDSGGQHVFLEVLPIFLTSRTMFLFIFNASERLFTNAKEMQKQEKGADMNNVLTLELMEQWMAMIYCQLAIKDTENPDIPAGYPQIYPIGTHGDKLDESAKKTLKTNIQSYCHIKDYNAILHREPLIVDNTKAGKGKDEDPGYKTIREAVSKMVTDNLQVPTPVAWVLFRVVVGKLNRTILSYEEACEIADQCRISVNECSSVLNFYHELGVFLFYSHIKGLQDKVIVDPKWLVDQLGKLLKIEESSYDTCINLWWTFKKEGRVQKALYETVWKGCAIKPSVLMDLLVSFHLASPVPHSQEEHKEEFFVPCVLDYDEEFPPPVLNCQEAAAPLFIVFKPLRFVPPGFFTRLITWLANNSNYKIDFDLAVHRKCVTYSLKSHEKDKVTLTELPSAFKVEVKRTDRTHLKPFYFICQDLLTTLQVSCKEVLHCYRNQTIFIKHKPAARITWKFAVKCEIPGCSSYCFFDPKEDLSLTCEEACHCQPDDSQLHVHWLSKGDKQAASTSGFITPQETMLTDKQLAKVKEELGDFSQWKTLGERLGLSPGSIERIESDCSGTDERLGQALLKWLRRTHNERDYGPPTWSNLVKALNPINPALAEEIQKKHCTHQGVEAGLMRAESDGMSTGAGAVVSQSETIHPTQTALPVQDKQSSSAQSLDAPCTDKYLTKLAHSIQDWEIIAVDFDISGQVAETIKKDYPQQNELQKRKMLMIWKEKFGNNATYRRLVQIFESVDNKLLADRIREDILQNQVEAVGSVSSHQAAMLPATQPMLATVSQPLPAHASSYTTPAQVPSSEEKTLAQSVQTVSATAKSRFHCLDYLGIVCYYLGIVSIVILAIAVVIGWLKA